MVQEKEALSILEKHRIPYRRSDEKGICALLYKNDVDLPRLRKLGFRVSHLIGEQLVIFYKGGRFGLIL